MNHPSHTHQPSRTTARAAIECTSESLLQSSLNSNMWCALLCGGTRAVDVPRHRSTQAASRCVVHIGGGA